MRPTIKAEQVTLTGKMAVVEASSLGMPPGQGFPWAFDTDIGSGKPFLFDRALDDGGACYLQADTGIELHVLND